MSKTNVICLTSVRNDSWILKNFIEYAKKWADLIIIGDHHSADDSATIARQYNCVRVISHQPSSSFLGRRRDLLGEARKVPGKRLIFLLDSDEIISANWADSSEWDLMLNAPPGTYFAFDWLELYPGLEQTAVFRMPAVFVDDGSEYPLGERIHGSRFPETPADIVELKDIKLLHLIAIDPERIISKHRYYKCYEYIELGRRPWALDVYYQDTKLTTYDAPLVPVKEEWIKGFDWLNEYHSNIERKEKCYWYDEEVLNYFDKYGVEKFRKLNIWDVDWNKKARLLGKKETYGDPRSSYEVWVHKFIGKYRKELKIKQNIPFKAARLFGKTGLRALGW